MTQHETLEVKAHISTDDAGRVTGVAWPFGAPDSKGDLIEQKAFAFAEKVPMLIEHDQRTVVGLWSDFTVTDAGLEVKGDLFVDGVAPARDARTTMQAGGMTGLSIGYRLHEVKARPEGGRILSKLTITEISLCRRPMHPDARVTEVKNNPEGNDMTTAAAATAPTVDEVKALTDRLTELETQLARPDIKGDNDNKGPSEEVKAFGTYIRSTPANPAPVEELKTLTVSSDTAGGYLAPAEFSTEFIRDLVQYSPIRAIASVRSTGSPSVIYPARTGITNAKWKGETQSQEASEPTFGQAEIPVNEINTYVDISNQLLADSAGVAEAEVRLALAEDFGQKEAAAFLTGTGTNMPKGLFVDPAIQSKAAANAAALSFDDFINVFYDLPAVYRNAGTWGLNSKTLAAARKLKDSQGSYLWQPSVQVGQPETILGRPVVELLEADDIGANKSPVIFGDFSGYRIVDRLALSILVNPYIKATEGITRFHATRRVGGAVLQAAKFRRLKNPA